ncbi:unnamed protein product [Heligmosomoides polygyrus]|uniref:BACK domain-containing protein n=1 Tax=Heligmosomoides polygyrus TaxID=6339 RepID=A0A183G9P1_HELPZ|nr:unnamed protein product [Heligmosomoides polygyrus]
MFPTVSLRTVMEMLSRDTFYAPEIEIFRALASWIQAQRVMLPDLLLQILKQLISSKSLRLHLMSQKELLTTVRRSEVFAAISGELSKCILDAMELKDSDTYPRRHQPPRDTYPRRHQPPGMCL